MKKLTELRKQLLFESKSDDRSQRSQSRKNLLNNLYKPGKGNVPAAINKDVISVSPHFFPIIADHTVKNREWYLYQLLRFSVGEPYNIDYHGFNFKLYGKNLSSVAENIYQLILDQITTFYSLLNDKDAVLRAWVVYFLSFISEQSEMTFKYLSERKAIETDEEVLCCLNMAMSTLDGYNGDNKAKPDIGGSIPGSIIQNITSTWSFHKYEGMLNQNIQFAFSSLVNLLQIPKKPSFKKIPWCNGDILRLATIALAEANPRDEEHGFISDKLLPILSRASESGPWAKECAKTALYQVFPYCTQVAPPDNGWESPEDMPKPLFNLIKMCLDNPVLLTQEVLSALGDNGVPTNEKALKAFFKLK